MNKHIVKHIVMPLKQTYPETQIQQPKPALRWPGQAGLFLWALLYRYRLWSGFGGKSTEKRCFITGNSLFPF